MTLVALANVLDRRRDALAVSRRAHREGRRTASAGDERRATCWWRGLARRKSAAARVRELVPPARAPLHTRRTIPTPRTQLLSNGRYAVMLTSAGSGYSRWRDIAVTRWREDATRDCWGSYIYLRDTQTNEVWSAGYQPMRR